MRVAKFGHSCLLVEAATGERILVDPGSMSAVPDEVIAAPLDAVLVTHSHADHLDEGTVAALVSAHPELPIFASADIVEQLARVGVSARDHGFDHFQVGAVEVEVIQAGHDPVLGPVPENAAYRIGGELVITGDSTAVSLEEWQGTRVLALVTSAPWGTRPALANVVERLRPEVAFPVHDGFLVDAFRGNQDAQFAVYCQERGTRYVILAADLTEL